MKVKFILNNFIKLKGNYSGQKTETFVIKPININDILTNEPIEQPHTGKAITLKGNLGTLKIGKDCTISYPGTVKEEGPYTLTVQGKGNYTGTKTIELMVTKKTFITKATVTTMKSTPYTGSAITPDVVVKIKGKSEPLEKDTDYTVDYKANTEIGTATIVIKGKGEYCGTKNVTFKITGTNIKSAKVTGIPKSVVYTGEEIKIDPSALELTVKVNGKDEVVEKANYDVTYSANTNKGKATIVFTGKNAYTGTLKKTFPISAYNIKEEANSKITVEPIGTVIYEKGGSKPKTVVKFGNITLKEGTDYTLSYKNHTAVTVGKTSAKTPTITIKGKGNFTGTRTVTFAIEQKDISDLTIAADNAVYSNKKNAYKSTPVVWDKNDQKLAAGKDFDVSYSYKSDTKLDTADRKANDPVAANDIPPRGTVIVVTITGKGNYKGSSTCEYDIVKTSIKSAKVIIEDQIYTGKKITPTLDEIKVKIGTTILGENDYRIVGYSNNTKVGTASVTIQGIGEYGGSKTIKFKIKAKKL